MVDEPPVERDWWWSQDDWESRPGSVSWWRMEDLEIRKESNVLMDVLEMVVEESDRTEIPGIVIDRDPENE